MYSRANSHTRCGYILLLTLLIISGTVAIVTYMFSRGSTYIPYAHMMLNRQKAKQLALGGVQVAIAQLAQVKDAEKKEAQKAPGGEQKSAPESEAKQLIKWLLPVINQWQTYDLTEAVDGIDGQLKVCIMCEEGKIDLNQIYDYQKKKFFGDGQNQDFKKLLEGVCKDIEQRSGCQNLLPAIEKLLKERHYKLHDVTELLHSKEFACFKQHQFYEPGSTQEKKDIKKGPVYLTDIFTVYSYKKTINPWFFSNSLVEMFGMHGGQQGDVEKRKKALQTILTNFKEPMQWSKDWDTTLKLIYDKDWQSLPKSIESFFEGRCDPKMFSARVHATVNGVTQQIFVILERIKTSQDTYATYDVTIKKVYWL